MAQHVVQLRRGHDHHLDFHLDGFGFDARGRDEVVGVEGLDLHFRGLQGALEGLPHPRFHDGVHQVQHQVAAVGLDERPGVDLGEIGAPQAGTVHDPLDGAEQVAVVGERFHDHRRSFQFCVVHQQVDLVGMQHRFRRGGHEHAHGPLHLLAHHLQAVQVFRHVGQHGLYVLLHLGVVVAFQQRLGEVAGRAHEHEPVHLFGLALHFLLQFAHVQEDGVDLFLQGLVGFLKFFQFLVRKAPLGGHFLQLQQVHRLPVHNGHDVRPLDLAHLHVHQHEAGIAHLGFQVLEELAGLPVVRLNDLVLAGDVFLALEKLRNVALHRFQKGLHVGLEGAALARRKAQQDGFFRRLEVVDEAQVVGRGFRVRAVAQQPLDHGQLADAHGPGDEDVVALALHAHAEAKGIHPPPLADDVGLLVHLAGMGEGQRCGVERPAHLFGREGGGKPRGARCG